MMENQARQFKHTQDAQEYQTDHKKASGKSIEHIGLDRQKKLERSLTGHQSSLLSQTCQYLTRYDGEFREPLVRRQRSLTPCVWPGRSRHCSRVMGGTRASRGI